jgi:hypothetical protein
MKKIHRQKAEIDRLKRQLAALQLQLAGEGR